MASEQNLIRKTPNIRLLSKYYTQFRVGHGLMLLARHVVRAWHSMSHTGTHRVEK